MVLTLDLFSISFFFRDKHLSQVETPFLHACVINSSDWVMIEEGGRMRERETFVNTVL